MSSGRSAAAVAALLAALAALAIVFVDVPLARVVARLPGGVHAVFREGTSALDFVSGKAFADTGLGSCLLVLALGAWLRPAWRPLAKLLVLVALSNLLAHLLAGVLKPVFGRLRPFQIEASGWDDRFFAGGSSFPSGHTAFYWGLALPLAWALPRWRWVALLPALFISAARVLVNHHFAGDVLASMAIALAVSAALIALFERGAKLAPFGEGHRRTLSRGL
ncbi:MAG: phosphatase PAP2 family protein [Planctomycetes bacterium]|nr:phosphatase PAP2 family protein [Planctomycetota bacterium]